MSMQRGRERKTKGAGPSRVYHRQVALQAPAELGGNRSEVDQGIAPPHCQLWTLGLRMLDPCRGGPPDVSQHPDAEEVGSLDACVTFLSPSDAQHGSRL